MSLIGRKSYSYTERWRNSADLDLSFGAAFITLCVRGKCSSPSELSQFLHLESVNAVTLVCLDGGQVRKLGLLPSN